MIKSLTIDNFALIDNLNVKFEKGLSIITGETGAGKSIILGALGLILGQRADSKSLRSDDRKCVIEGYFDIEQYGLESFFEENDLDFDKSTIIRREIYPSGKSRAFVNDVPVRLDTLQLLGESLVDIHSQHQTLKLSDPDFQMSVLDAVAGNTDLIEEYKSKLKTYKKAKKEFEKLQAQQAELIKAHDYNSFLLNELNEANLEDGEKEEKEEELEALTHAEDIKSGLSNAVGIMNGEQMGVIASLTELRSSLSSLSGISKNLDSFLERIESLLIESNDLASEIENLAEETEYNPTLIDELNDRLRLIYDLEKKHNTDKIEELLLIQENLQKEVDSVENLDQELDKLMSRKNNALELVNTIANKLHNRRESKITEVVKQVSNILSELGMPNAELGIELSKSDKLLKDGKDNVMFMLSANKGGKMDDIGKVASGGELSRVMLAVKTILSEKKNLPSIIFDEIDTGVSGDIADKIGNIMTVMANRMQVISITHLPQIAGRGNLHYKVFKHDEDGITKTEMQRLNNGERVDELAKMLSGSNISESAMLHAKELLKV
ncbi:MAG: DNA repair protein RecN [Bacteroidota bacterium]